MKIINAYDGREIRVGDTFLDPYVLFPSHEYEQWLGLNRVERLAALGRCRKTIPRPGVDVPPWWRIRATEYVVCDMLEPPPAQPVRLLAVDEKLLSAKAYVEGPTGMKGWIPLTVRMTHPSFPLQRVAFIQT